MMRLIFFSKLFFLSLYRSFPKLLVSTVGIYISVVVLLMGFAFEKSIRQSYQKNFLGSLPIQRILVMPPKPAKPKLTQIPLMGGAVQKPHGLTYTDFVRIKRLKQVVIRGMIMPVHLPVTLKANFLNRGIRTDIVLLGVSRSLMWHDIVTNKKFEARMKNNTKTYPILLPRFILTAYNSFAEVNGLPAFSAKKLGGVQMQLIIGKSSLADSLFVDKKMLSAEIVGVSDLPHLYGLAIPMTLARQLNRQLPHIKRDYYSAIFLDVQDPTQVSAISKKLENWGLRTKSAADISAKANNAMYGVRLILQIFSGLILFFTAMTMVYGFNAMVATKQREWMVFRILGASKLWIIFFLLLQVVVVSFFYVQLAKGSAVWFMEMGNQYYLDFLRTMKQSGSEGIHSSMNQGIQESIAILGDKIFLPIPELANMMPFLAIVFALMTVLFPAIRAANISLAKSMED